MTTLLLDANVLIALTVRDHVHHERVRRWFARRPSIALCAVAEGALVRFLVRQGEAASTAQQLIRGVLKASNCEFWSDAPSYTDVDLTEVHGHRQVTDAYLVGLAVRRGGRVVTLDNALSQQYPASTLLLPESPGD